MINNFYFNIIYLCVPFRQSSFFNQPQPFKKYILTKAIWVTSEWNYLFIFLFLIFLNNEWCVVMLSGATASACQFIIFSCYILHTHWKPNPEAVFLYLIEHTTIQLKHFKIHKKKIKIENNIHKRFKLNIEIYFKIVLLSPLGYIIYYVLAVYAIK